MSVKRPVTPARAPRRARSAAQIVNDALALFARLAAVVCCASLLYLIYGVFSGALRQFPGGFTPALSNALSYNVQVAGKALVGSSIVLSVCMLALFWGWEWAGPFFAVVGGALYAALPYYAVPFLSEASRSLARQNHPGTDILEAFRDAGVVLLAAAGLFTAVWIADRLQASLTAPRKAGGRLKVPFYSACWQTHYCGPEISKLCAPGRGGYHKSCWRHKSGCMCDESIADRVLADARKKMGKDAAKWLGNPAKAPAPTFADHLRPTWHKAPNQKVACADCVIYGYHEVQKHRILTPIVMLSIPALMVYYAESLHRWYSSAVVALDKFSLHLAFDPSHTALMKSQIHGALDVPAMEWLVYIITGLFLITTAARLLEIWCFEIKL